MSDESGEQSSAPPESVPGPPVQPPPAQSRHAQPETAVPEPDPLADQNDRDRARHYTFDLVTGLLLSGFCALTSAYDLPRIALSLALTLPWIIRRRRPLIALVVATAAAIGQVLAFMTPLFAIMAVPLLIYSFARWSPPKLARTSIVIGLSGAIIGPARWWLFGALPETDGLLFTLVMLVITALACASIVSVAYVIGTRRRETAERHLESIREAMERQRLTLAEQEQRARAAAIDERNRIARELHDIVAHSLSVIVVQAEGGRALAAKKPEKGPEVLSTVADTSREALEEMRRMVGLLRSGSTPGVDPGGGSDNYVPAPGLADLPDLVAKTGDRVRLHRNGAQPYTSEALRLTAYRIVQESLTNFLKYAGPDAEADVVVDYGLDGIRLKITDDGVSNTHSGAAGTPAEAGHGLQGMAERVAMHQGRLSAQPRPSGGFEVHAWLPLASTAESPQNRR